jgi:hypothetical protein
MVVASSDDVGVADVVGARSSCSRAPRSAR